MGCAGSKLDDLEAVAICKARSQFLDDAIRHRYALANYHASYIGCLRSVGDSLHRFFLATDLIPPSSPVLTLPAHRKGDPLPPLSPLFPSPPPPAIPIANPSAAPAHLHSHSNSGSHIHFHSSGEDSDSDDGPLHSDHSSPLHHMEPMDDRTTTTTTTTYFNFARKGAPTSAVTYEQRPYNPDVAPVQVGGFGVGGGDPSSSSYPYHYNDPYYNQNPNYYGSGASTGNINSNSSGSGYPYAYPYPYPPAYGGMGGGFFGSSSPPPTMAPPPPAASTSRPTPPPPSPPRASTWDFLNPFETYENYQHTYTPSRSSKDLREEEGIPDLEDEEQEVVKEAYGDQKFAGAASSSATGGGEMHSSKAVAMEEDGPRRSIGEEVHYEARASGAGEGDVHLADKKVVGGGVQQRPPDEGMRRKAVPGSRSVPDVVNEIKAQFDRASGSCEEISKLLEVGKLPYQRRKYEVVSSKMMFAITPSLTTTTSSQTSASRAGGSSDTASTLFIETDKETGMKAGNLSSTLQKLYIWEKKLLEEVKAEEKMRLDYDRKCKRLKRLHDDGAEATKIQSTEALVKKLSTKIRIAIQVVDSISHRIDKLRDEELWPQLHELIQGLVRMWQVMTECHRSQCQAIMEAKNLNDVAFAGKLSDAHMEATMQLGLDLLNWIEIFSNWVYLQKSYVKALNDWLMKCLPDEREETADGIAPFSPGRLGAPPVFVICNDWWQAIDRISEREVIEAMQSFTTSVLQVWQRHYVDRRHRMLANRDMDRRLKALEMEDLKIHKAVVAVNKRRALAVSHGAIPYAGEIMHVSDNPEASNHLQPALTQIFEAMERFTESSMKAYEELHIRCEEERQARARPRVS